MMTKYMELLAIQILLIILIFYKLKDRMEK